MTQWRLLPFLEAPGTIQMAFDEWLLDQHRLGLMPSVLRFYSWRPAAISLGYHQHQYPEDWNTLTWKGTPVDIVRRPSGGRAVLHQGDLTYAVITSSDVLSGLGPETVELSVSTASSTSQALPEPTPKPSTSNQNKRSRRTIDYQAICQFLIHGFRSLGFNLSYGTAGRGYINNPNCFGTATAADLVLPDGTKLIGSAQLRRGNAILQHGSIRILPDAALFDQVFGQNNSLPSRTLWQQSALSLADTTERTETVWDGHRLGASSGVSSGVTLSAQQAAQQKDTERSLHPSISHLQQTLITSLTASARTCFQMDTVSLEPLCDEEWNTVLAQSHKWHKPTQNL